ncbi:Tbc1 Domain Family Member 19, partial [Manis pentadactyla]
EGDSPELFEGGNEEVGQSVLETQETTCKGDGAEQLGIWRTRKGLVELGHKAGLEDCGGQGSR